MGTKLVETGHEVFYAPTIVNVPWTITYCERVETTPEEDKVQHEYMRKLILDAYSYKTPEMISKEKRLAKAKAKKVRT